MIRKITSVTNSEIKDFTQGRFIPVIDQKLISAKNVKKVVFCSGKFY